MLGHEEVVAQQHQKRSIDSVQGACDCITHAALLHLLMHEKLHTVARIEVMRMNVWTEMVQFSPPFQPRVQVFAGSRDDVDPCCSSVHGLLDQMCQQGHVHQRQRFFGQHCAGRKHPSSQPARDDERVLDRSHEVRSRRTAFQASARTGHVAEHRWEAWAGVGTLLIAQTFLDVVPAGPWGNAAMGAGFLGLLGVACLYIAWFRRTFSTSGLLPTSDLWQDPAGTWPKVVAVGGVFLVLSYLAGRGEVDAWMPEPAGLVLSLVGLLVVLNGLYVGAITGPLSEEE